MYSQIKVNFINEFKSIFYFLIVPINSILSFNYYNDILHTLFAKKDLTLFKKLLLITLLLFTN